MLSKSFHTVVSSGHYNIIYGRSARRWRRLPVAYYCDPPRARLRIPQVQQRLPVYHSRSLYNSTYEHPPRHRACFGFASRPIHCVVTYTCQRWRLLDSFFYLFFFNMTLYIVLHVHGETCPKRTPNISRAQPVSTDIFLGPVIN